MKKIIAMLPLALLAACGTTPESAAQDMFEAVQKGECDGFQERFSKATRQMFGAKIDRSCRDMAAKAATAPEGQQLAEMKVLEKSENGDVVLLQLQPVLNDGTTQKPIRMRMVKEEGFWRAEPSK